MTTATVRPGVRLTDDQRLAWLRLIRSDNVGPRGIMAHPPQAPLNYPMPRPQVIPRDPQADAEWWLAKLRGLLGSEDGEAWLARERLAQGHQTTGRNERDSKAASRLDIRATGKNRMRAAKRPSRKLSGAKKTVQTLKKMVSVGLNVTPQFYKSLILFDIFDSRSREG